MFYEITLDFHVQDIVHKASEDLARMYRPADISKPLLVFGIRNEHPQHIWLGKVPRQGELMAFLSKKGFLGSEDARFQNSLGIRRDIRERSEVAVELVKFTLLFVNGLIGDLVFEEA